MARGQLQGYLKPFKRFKLLTKNPEMFGAWGRGRGPDNLGILKKSLLHCREKIGGWGRVNEGWASWEGFADMPARENPEDCPAFSGFP